MRIVIDMQCLQTTSRYRGIGHYTQSLVRELLRQNRNLELGHDFLLLFNSYDIEAIDQLRRDWGDLLDPDSIRIFRALPDTAELTTSNPVAVRASEILRDDFIARLQPDFVLVMSLFEGMSEPFVSHIPAQRDYAVGVIGYDLIPLISPDQYLGDPLIRRWYERKLDSLRRADRIFAISDSSRREFEAHLTPRPGVVCNISSACDSAYGPLPEDAEFAAQELARLAVNRPFILYSGAADERKNLQGLFQAYARLDHPLRDRHQLVLVGQFKERDQAHLKQLARQCGIDPASIIYTGFVSQPLLNLLYNRCAAFVFPSFHEGFGLPVLEAITCGAPTICSNTTSLPEVIGLEEATFDPRNHAQMSARLTQVLTDTRYRERLIAHGLKQAQRFSWADTATTVLNQIESAVTEAPAGSHSAGTIPSRIDLLADLFHSEPADDALDNTLRRAANCLAANDLALTRRLPTRTSHWRIEGPFDSSYSLALLNRETARALADLGQQVTLHSTEGPGDFDPDPAFLARHPDINQLYQRSLPRPENDPPTATPDVVSRNLYPPRVADMVGDVKLLHHYAWEETGFPAEWVDDFNRHLTGITCLSEHVRKVLIDNGVTLPLTVSGCGVDHWDRIEAEPFDFETCGAPARGFRFLHVSSCFPRKGVDALLAAWGRAFSKSDDVSLVIKTFDNPHNDIRDRLARQRAANPDYPDVVLIVDDLPDTRLKGLYQQCHALVAPSKAEGFGLPLAEAMLSGLPVITTGWSGQLDFCSDDTAWLVDYHFEPADSHFNLPGSLWATPDVEDLARALQAVHRAVPEELHARVQRGAQLLREQFSWASVAINLVNQAESISELRAATDLQQPLRIGWVSSWNQKCGLATYSQHLVEQNRHDQLLMLAPETDALSAADDPDTVERCWRLDDRDDLQRLGDTILRQQLQVVVIQMNLYFYDYAALTRLIARLKAHHIVVTLTLHATFDPEPRKALHHLRGAFELVDRVIVHTPRDLNRLKELGVAGNAVMIPHGILDHQPAAVEWPFEGKRCIASYGFALPHKGLEQLVEAFARLRGQYPDLVLLLLNAEHPDGTSAAFIRQLQQLIHDLGVADSVHADHRFLPDAESLGLLSRADVIAMPYQDTGESSSGAVKMALASGAPVMVTPLPIFDDVASAVDFFGGQDVDALEHGLRRALNGQLTRNAADVADWKASRAYPVIAGRLFAMLRSLWINRTQPIIEKATTHREFSGTL